MLQLGTPTPTALRLYFMCDEVELAGEGDILGKDTGVVVKGDTGVVVKRSIGAWG